MFKRVLLDAIIIIFLASNIHFYRKKQFKDFLPDNTFYVIIRSCI